MTKPGYLFIGVDMHDEDVMRRYVDGTTPILLKHGCEFIALDDNADLLDGEYRRQRLVLLRFPSLDAVRAFWDDPDYKPMKELRKDASETDVLRVEGFGESQPDQAGEDGEKPVFLVGRSQVRNPEAMKPYLEFVPPISARYGAQVLVANPDYEVLEGSWPAGTFITLRFPSEKAFRGFWSDPDYLPYKQLREDNSEGMHLMVRGV
ncbi:MAG: DUF1330 domain-containing protein [Alphaproteobacteria bacterium]|nr:DUF1330 domain-containing protein [Alphaproteobacteria bacterium]